MAHEDQVVRVERYLGGLTKQRTSTSPALALGHRTAALAVWKAAAASPSGRPRNAGGLFATARPRGVVSGDMSATMSSTSVYKSTSASSALLSDGTATQSRRRRVDGVEAAVKI